MGFNTSGIYTRYDGTRTTWQDDATNGVKIEADLHDNHDNDLADALSLTILKNGKSTITDDIPFSGRKIVNLGAATADTDAVQFAQVKNWRDFSTGIVITGADLNGRITFGPTATGVTGLSWVNADLSWLAKQGEASKTQNRLVLNDSALGSATVGTDVFIIDERGMTMSNAGQWAHNYSYDGAVWRTISPGTGEVMTLGGGTFTVYSNDTASITNPYSEVTIRNFFSVGNSDGTVTAALSASASGKTNQILGNVAGTARWNIQMGNGAAEAASNVGSNFTINRYSNTGAYLGQALAITRASGNITTEANITAGGTVVSSQNFSSSTANVVLGGGGGGAYLRPHGPGNSTYQAWVDSDGEFTVANAGGIHAGKGLFERVGSTGAYGTNYTNFNWDGSDLAVYSGAAPGGFLGYVAWQSDYRIKRDVEPLPSMWDKVKNLAPISYRQKAFRIWVDRDAIRWGFAAHELQDALTPAAASGVKDGDEVQSPNHWVVIAALTKALQEAMARIEALEARA